MSTQERREKFPDKQEEELVRDQLNHGGSLTSSQDKVEMDEFQEIVITERPYTRRKLEDLILQDFIEQEKIIWRTHGGKEIPLEEMDEVDFKLVAACHALRRANDLHMKCQEAWRKCARKRRDVFMELFSRIEEHLRENHEIDLPERLEDIKELRDNLNQQ